MVNLVILVNGDVNKVSIMKIKAFIIIASTATLLSFISMSFRPTHSKHKEKNVQKIEVKTPLQPFIMDDKDQFE